MGSEFQFVVWSSSDWGDCFNGIRNDSREIEEVVMSRTVFLHKPSGCFVNWLVQMVGGW